MLVVRVNRILHTRRKDLPPETFLPFISIGTLIRQREPSFRRFDISPPLQPTIRTYCGPVSQRASSYYYHHSAHGLQRTVPPMPDAQLSWIQNGHPGSRPSYSVRHPVRPLVLRRFPVAPTLPLSPTNESAGAMGASRRLSDPPLFLGALSRQHPSSVRSIGVSVTGTPVTAR